MARVNGPSRIELDARGDEFAARVTRAIRTTLRDVAQRTYVVDDLARIQTVWRSVVTHSLAPHLRKQWDVAVQGVREQLEKINARESAAVTAAVFEIPKVTNPLAESFMENATNRLVAIGDVVWYTARGEMLTGLQLGEGVAEVRERVKSSINVSAKRAQVIARTELNSAMNNGAYAQMKALNVATVKEWIATPDDRTRESHEEVDGEEIDGDAKFMVGGFPMDHPHDLNGPPSETINCRCTLAWEIVDDEDDDFDYLVGGGFDEAEHPRDGKGKFAKKPGGAGKKLKITHALIHGKHEPGTIIAVNGSDDKRSVWDGTKYLLQEKQADGGWVTVDTAIKTKAYAAMGKFDDDWRKPGDGNSTASDIQVAEKPTPATKTKPGGPKGEKEPGSPLNITYALVYGKHQPGDVIAENGAGDKRVVWDGAEHRLQRKKDDGSWTTEKKFKKGQAYDAIKAYDSDWRVPTANDVTTDADVIPDDFFDTPLADEPKSSGPKFPQKPKIKQPKNISVTPAPTATSAPKNPSKSNVLSGPQPLTGYKKIGGQAGSNTGGLYQAPNGEKWYAKAPKTDDHARNEVLANRLYERAGVKVPEVELTDLSVDSPFPGKTGLGIKSKIVDGERDLKDKVLKSSAFKSKLYENFAVDAWLGNWDVVGLGYDNVISDKNGEPLRIDAGGSLLFRAQGMSKGSAFGDKVTEIDSLRNSSVNPQAANVFSGVTDDDIRKGVAKIEAIQPAEIDALVDDAGFKGKVAQRLKDTLKARRADLVKRFGSDAKKTSVTPSPTADTISAPGSTATPTSLPTAEPASTTQSKFAGAEPKSMFNLTKVKPHKKGAIFTDPAGTEFLVAPQPSEAHARSQFLAANLYYFAGVKTEQTDLVEIDPAKMPGKSGVGVKTKIETPSPYADVNDPFFLKDNSKEQLAKGFAIDAWLGNWNVAGTNGENLVVTKSGDVYRSNLGGSLFFRANGGSKELSDTVDEIDSLRNPSTNPASAKIFKDVTNADIRDAVANLEKITPNTIDFIVEQSGFTGPEAEKLKKKLKARRQDLINRYGSLATKAPSPGIETAPAPSSQPTATNALGGTKTFTALQKAKVKNIFDKHGVKWYNKTHAIYDAALEVSKTHPDLTVGDALDIMDSTLKKTDKPFRTKVEKWLKTNSGKSHVISVGGSAPVGSTASKVSPTVSVNAPNAATPKPAVEFVTALPRELTVKDADTLQERMDKAYPPPWNASQRAALTKYTGDSYIPINNCLRGIDTCTPALESTIKQLRSAMKPSTDNVVVYRKTDPKAFGIKYSSTPGSSGYPHLNEELSALVGKTFEDQGVTSTSISQGKWHGLVHMEIEVPKGARIAWVKRLSKHSHEDEIVLAPGTRFEVVSVTPAPDFPGGQHQLLKLRVVVSED